MGNSTVKVYDNIEAIKTEWERLARETQCSPFLWPGWTSAWWDAFGRGQLRIFAAYQDGRLAGVLPLQWANGVLSSTTNNENYRLLFGFLVVNDGVAKLLLRTLFSQGARRIDLSFLDATEVGISLVRAAAGDAGYEILGGPIRKVPYLALSETSWETYESGLRAKLRSELRRRRRRLEEEGRLTLEVFDGTERLEELLEEGFRVEGSGWKDAIGESVNSSPAHRRFLMEMARRTVEHGWLRLAFLLLNGRTLAFNYCLEYNDIHYTLKSGYDPAYSKFSPGMILRHLMLARAFSEGISTYEFLGEFDAWKREWTDTYHELQSLHMFTREGCKQDPWFKNLRLAVKDMGKLIPPGKTFVLIDEDSWQIDAGNGRQTIPFLERYGLYWGPPPDDETAIRELERLRGSGAGFVVFGWPAFWWLDHYVGFRRHLRSRFRCLLENERVVVFDLRQE